MRALRNYCSQNETGGKNFLVTDFRLVPGTRLLPNQESAEGLGHGSKKNCVKAAP